MSETMSAHILVVDDDPQIRNLLSEYLAENGMRVSSAETASVQLTWPNSGQEADDGSDDP